MCPYGAKLLTGKGAVLGKAELCTHVLLVEAADALVLVETGFGRDDVANQARLGQPFRAMVRPRPRYEETAHAQISSLGLDPADVRHIVLTHLDLDHAGGLPDFPDAEVHVFRPEMEAALRPSIRERGRYISEHFAHGPRWSAHEVDGDSWMGFEAVRALGGIDPEVIIVPLPGHSRGHSAVAVKEGDGWLLHCGDAYFHRHQLAKPPSCPPGMALFQAVVGYERRRRLENLERLRELVRRKGDEITPFCAHDLEELRSFEAGESAGKKGTEDD